MNRHYLLAVGARLRKACEGTRKAPLTPAMLALLVQLREKEARDRAPAPPRAAATGRKPRRGRVTAAK